eukprot:superscaffoldBa00003879_g17882
MQDRRPVLLRRATRGRTDGRGQAGQITSVALKDDQVNDQTCGGPLEFGEEGWATLEVGNEGWAAMEVGDEGGGQEGQPTPEDSAAGRGRVQERQIAGVQSRWRAAGDLAWHRQRWLTDDLGGLAVWEEVSGDNQLLGAWLVSQRSQGKRGLLRPSRETGGCCGPAERQGAAAAQQRDRGLLRPSRETGGCCGPAERQGAAAAQQGQEIAAAQQGQEIAAAQQGQEIAAAQQGQEIA